MAAAGLHIRLSQSLAYLLALDVYRIERHIFLAVALFLLPICVSAQAKRPARGGGWVYSANKNPMGGESKPSISLRSDFTLRDIAVQLNKLKCTAGE